MSRTSLSARSRFEVFKRDRFTCQYCGKHPPNVLLQVDHIVPVAGGGTDRIDNLTTACQECNAGKSDRLLEEGSGPVRSRQSNAELRERLEQAQQYAALVTESQSMLGDQVWQVTAAWGKAFGATESLDAEGKVALKFVYLGSHFPNEASLRVILRRLPVEIALEAVDICASKFGNAGRDTERYFFGICWRRLERLEGG